MNTMNINNVYSRSYLLPEDCHSNFEPYRKRSLNTIELIGLEAILIAFVQQYEEAMLGEVYTKNLSSFTRYNDDSVDILDGVYDTYIFDNYAIGSIWMTDNGIPMLGCYLLESDEYEDPCEIVQYTDWMSECKYALFRLN